MENLNRRSFFECVAALGAGVLGAFGIKKAATTTLTAATWPPDEPTIRVKSTPPTFPEPPKPEWHGDPLDHNWTVRQYTGLIPQFDWYGDHVRPLFNFFDGEQWDQEVQKMRMRQSRPTLVINKIPLIIGRCVQNSQSQGEDFDWQDYRKAKIAAVRRNADAQRMFNYMASAQVEVARLYPRTVLFVDKEFNPWQRENPTTTS